MKDGYESEEVPKAAQAQTNTQRLRTHLKEGGLAATLLSAWEAGEPATAQERLLDALNHHHIPRPAKNDEAKA